MASDLPKLTTNEKWRADMKLARVRDHKLKQDELADLVGKFLKEDAPSQALISKIEAGIILTSEYVGPIGHILGIGLPEHNLSEEEKHWADLGRVLRHKDMSQYKSFLHLLESIADVADAADPAPPPAAEKPGPTRK